MKSKKETMSWKLLKWIGEQPNGVALSDIQYYIWVTLEGKTHESFHRVDGRSDGSSPQLRCTRGHWNTALYGGIHYHGGLLHLYCEQRPGSKNWYLKRMPHPTKPIYRSLIDVGLDNQKLLYSKKNIPNKPKIDTPEPRTFNKFQKIYKVIKDFPGGPPLGILIGPDSDITSDFYEMAPNYPQYFEIHIPNQTFKIKIIRTFNGYIDIDAKDYDEAMEQLTSQINNIHFKLTKSEIKEI